MKQDVKIYMYLLAAVVLAVIGYIVYNSFIKPQADKDTQTTPGSTPTPTNTGAPTSPGSTSPGSTSPGATSPSPTPSAIGRSMYAAGTGANLLYENFTVFKTMAPGSFIGKVTAERGGYYETAITGGTGKGLVNKISVTLS